MSINLAIRASLQKNVPEDKLAYGFNRMPIEQLPRKIIASDLPEERLWSGNGPVIELRRPKSRRPQSGECDDEDETEDTTTKSLDSVLSYGELGYGFTRRNDPVFITKSLERCEEEPPIENYCLQPGSVEPVCESHDNGQYRSEISYF